MNIVKAEKQNSAQVAQLHIQGINTGFISSLGQKFVQALYDAIIDSEQSFLVVAEEAGHVVAFIAVSSNLSGLYRHVALKNGIKFAFILASKMMSLVTIKKVIANIFYPSKMKKAGLPDAELLAIVVAPEYRGRGIAKQLINKCFDECKLAEIEEIKVLVAADNESANKTYIKSGFNFKAAIDSHGVKSNVYVKSLG